VEANGGKFPDEFSDDLFSFDQIVRICKVVGEMGPLVITEDMQKEHREKRMQMLKENSMDEYKQEID